MSHCLHICIRLKMSLEDRYRCYYTFPSPCGLYAMHLRKPIRHCWPGKWGLQERCLTGIGSHRKGQVIKHRDCASSYPASDLQGINSELNLRLTNSSSNAAGRTSLEGPAIKARLTRDTGKPRSEVWRKMNWGSLTSVPRLVKVSLRRLSSIQGRLPVLLLVV